MTATAVPFIFDNREWVARASALLCGAAFVLFASQLAIRHELPTTKPPIRITLAEIPVPIKPPPVIEPPPPPAPMPHVPQQKPLSTAVPPSTPVAATTPAPAAAAPAAVSLPDLPVSPAAKAIPEPIEVPRSNSGAEGRFAQDVRAKIEQKKIFPETARELGMSGAVEVAYVLDRTGKLLKAEVAVSSGFPLLDQAAVRAVRAAVYGAFPHDAWIGELQKEFRTKLVFSIIN